MAKISKVVWKSNNGISASFGQVGGMIVAAVNDELQNMALEIQKKAREYVPVDLGYAESAIKIDKQNQRRSWAVYLDLDEQAMHDGREYPVGDYIVWLHENQNYNLGPKSMAKEQMLGVTVGPKFLERAFADVMTPERMRNLTNDLNAVIKERTDARVRRKLAASSARFKEESDKLASGE